MWWDAYLRWSGVEHAGIEKPSAWLAKVVANLSLTRLTSARARRERYVGPWLPEPVLTEDGALGPLETAEQRESVSLALLALLERLSPWSGRCSCCGRRSSTAIARSRRFWSCPRRTAASCGSGPATGSMTPGRGFAPIRGGSAFWWNGSCAPRKRATSGRWRACWRPT